MKIKITKTDGTIVDAEGTAEECQRLIQSQYTQNIPSVWILAGETTYNPFNNPYDPHRVTTTAGRELYIGDGTIQGY